MAEKMLLEVHQHGAKIIESDRMKFADLAQQYEEAKLIPPKYQGDAKIAGLRSYKTQQRRLKTLVDHFGHRLIKSITHGDLERFKLQRLELPTWRGDERSHADVNRDLALLRIVLNYAKKQGWMAKNPFERGEALITSAHETKRDRVLGREEERLLLLACKKPARQHLRPILILLLDTADAQRRSAEPELERRRFGQRHHPLARHDHEDGQAAGCRRSRPDCASNSKSSKPLKSANQMRAFSKWATSRKPTPRPVKRQALKACGFTICAILRSPE